MDYCFTVKHFSATDQNHRQVRKICRTWERVALGPAVTRPDFSTLPLPPDNVRALYETHGRQATPDALPSYDELRIDSRGRFWVRTLPSRLAHIHPAVLTWHPEQGPENRNWDVFGDDGALLATVVLPAAFLPAIITEDAAYGPFELPSGELVVAVVTVPSGLQHTDAASQR
jgi:hypothetical protein